MLSLPVCESTLRGGETRVKTEIALAPNFFLE